MKILRLYCDNAAVVNLDEAAKFFQDVLGAKIGPEMAHGKHYGVRAKHAWLGTEETYCLELIEGVAESKHLGASVKRMAPRFRTVSLEVDNLEEWVKTLRAKGIEVTDILDLTPVGFGKMGYDNIREVMIHPKDSCGLRIELLEIKGKRPEPGMF